jgi:hypothetical protein
MRNIFLSVWRVTAPADTCRQQIADGAGRKSVHVARVLERTINDGIGDRCRLLG